LGAAMVVVEMRLELWSRHRSLARSALAE
jgi:hypothetical protein